MKVRIGRSYRIKVSHSSSFRIQTENAYRGRRVEGCLVVDGVGPRMGLAQTRSQDLAPEKVSSIGCWGLWRWRKEPSNDVNSSDVSLSILQQQQLGLATKTNAAALESIQHASIGL